MQEVRHGKWEAIIDAHGHIEGWLHKDCGRQVTSKDEYCPKCGAKMDKEQTEMTLESYLFGIGQIKDEIFIYYVKPPKPPKKIGKTRNAIINKKHIYYHCRSMLK